MRLDRVAVSPAQTLALLVRCLARFVPDPLSLRHIPMARRPETTKVITKLNFDTNQIVKTKYLWRGLGAVALAGGLWFGPAAWRAHQQIVTLHVRNAPLAEVLRKIERQTWKNIRAEKALDARITLNVVNQPLTYVLDRVAAQAGAQWSTLYAVYDSPSALTALDTALRGDGKLGPAGWTKLAPEPPKLIEPQALDDFPQRGTAPVIEKSPTGFSPGPTVTATEDSTTESTPTSKSTANVHGPDRMRYAPRTLRIVKKGASDGSVEEELWSPEELLVETALKPRLGHEQPQNDIPLAAVQTAQKVNAHWRTYVAFRKSAMGIGFAGRRFGQFVDRGHGPLVNGTNSEDRQSELPPPNLEEAAKQERNDLFERLTPEQRVRRAREFSTQTGLENQNPP